MIKPHALKMSPHWLRATYRDTYKEKLEALRGYSGAGREGLPDGWIEPGVSNYRPYLRGSGSLYDRHIAPSDPSIAGVSTGLRMAVAEVAALIGDPTIYLHQIIINRMEPGSRLNWHVDGAPYYHRYHIPIVSDGVKFWEGDQTIMMYEGTIYGPISYWLPHKVENHTAHERVHAIFDFGPSFEVPE